MKIFLHGLLSGSVLLLISMTWTFIFSTAFPGVGEEYKNPAIFRSWSEPLMMLYFLHPFVLGVVLSWLWHDAKKALGEGGDNRHRALLFGFAVWLVATVPGMLMTYASFQLSLLIILSWTVGSLIALIGASILLVRLNP